MNDYQNLPEDDPRHHTGHIQHMLDDLIEHLRADVGKIDEPSAQALFETSVEVLKGLKTAYRHYEERSEKAWQH